MIIKVKPAWGITPERAVEKRTCLRQPSLGFKYIPRRLATQTVGEDFSGTRGPEDPCLPRAEENRMANRRWLTHTQNCWLPHNSTTDQATEMSSRSRLTGKIRKEWPGENGLEGTSWPGTWGAHSSKPWNVHSTNSCCCRLEPGGW